MLSLRMAQLPSCAILIITGRSVSLRPKQLKRPASYKTQSQIPYSITVFITILPLADETLVRYTPLA